MLTRIESGYCRPTIRDGRAGSTSVSRGGGIRDQVYVNPPHKGFFFVFRVVSELEHVPAG